MKIYFYDGSMYFLQMMYPHSSAYDIDARYGVSDNVKQLESLRDKDIKVFTNSILALSNSYGWNKEENHTDIYLWVDELNNFIRIDYLTNKEIRYAHNIEKLYLNDIFKYKGQLYEPSEKSKEISKVDLTEKQNHDN